MNTLFFTHVCCFILIFFEYSHLELIVSGFKFVQVLCSGDAMQIYIYFFSENMGYGVQIAVFPIKDI